MFEGQVSERSNAETAKPCWVMGRHANVAPSSPPLYWQQQTAGAPGPSHVTGSERLHWLLLVRAGQLLPAPEPQRWTQGLGVWWERLSETEIWSQICCVNWMHYRGRINQGERWQKQKNCMRNESYRLLSVIWAGWIRGFHYYFFIINYYLLTVLTYLPTTH